MDPKLSEVASQRISALFRGKEPEKQMNFETKNRSKELKRLATAMDMDVPKLKEFLGTERSKVNDSSGPGKYVEWVATKEPKNGSATQKKQNSDGDAGPGQHKRTNTGKGGDNPKKQRKENDSVPMDIDAPEPKGKGKGKAGRKQGSGDGKQSNDGKRDPKNGKAKTQPGKAAPEEDKAVNQSQTSEGFGGTSQIVDKTLLTDTAFANLDGLHSSTKRAISEKLGLTYMTEIQSKTYAAASAGKDVLGRARTGTGKTMAFLLPSLERLLSGKDLYKPKSEVGILVVSPTRELATQIATQAEKLITFHKDIVVQVMYGGTKMGRDMSLLNRRIPNILVATPGRLLDHLENTVLKNGKKFGASAMASTPVLVLDETDRLLDMGFRREIAKILSYMPKKEARQTLLFSATVPKELKQIMSENMRKDFVEADCIHDGSQENGGQHTSAHVEQTHVILPSMDRYLISVVEIVQKAIAEDQNEHKIVVFFPTARLVGFFADFFNVGLKNEVIEIHSRKSQNHRDKASDKFRHAKKGVLFTSDVSARGVDYPNVTHVIQFGLPESREQYIHRLGRTGRAGKSGQGLLVLAPFESKFISELTSIDIPKNQEVMELLNSAPDENLMRSVNAVLGRVNKGDSALVQSAEQAYRAFLGYYNGQLKRITLKSKAEIVEIANTFSSLTGLKETPSLEPRTVGKMGLKGVPGLRVAPRQRQDNRGRGAPNHRGRRN